MQACAAKLGFAYTRYADDLTFSGDAAARKLAGKLLWRIKQIIADEGFTPHPEKQHVMSDAHCQSVTGIVVNKKLSLDRDTLRRFRATLFQVEKDGPAGKQWNGNENVIDALEGYAQFIKMVDAAKGAPLLQQVRAARAKWAAPTPAASAPVARRSSGFRALSAQGKEPWAGFWQAAAPPAPVQEKTQQQLTQEKIEAKQKPATPTSGPSRPTARPAAEAPAAAPARGGRGTFTGRPWVAIVVQVYFAITLGLNFHTSLPFVVAVVLAVSAWRNYSAKWPRYFCAMLLAVIAGMVLR